MAKAVETLKKPTVATPPPPADYRTDKGDPAAKHLWEQEAKEAIRDKVDLDRAVKQLYSLVTGQCSEAMLARLEAHSECPALDASRDAIGLLRVIKSICFNFHDQKYTPQSIHEAKVRFYAIRQGRFEAVAQHYERYQNNTHVLEQCGGEIGLDFAIWKIACKEKGFSESTEDPDEHKVIKTVARDRMFAAGLILGADRG